MGTPMLRRQLRCSRVRSRLAVAWLLAAVLIAARPATAVSLRSESLEWWTSASDTIIVGRIVKAEFGKCDGTTQEEWATVAPDVALRGTAPSSIRIRGEYWTTKGSHDRPFTVGDQLLLFQVPDPSTKKSHVAFWANLTQPNIEYQALYDNDCRELHDAKTILTLVKSRIAIQRPEEIGQRGLIVMFPETRDIYHDFVRTADASYKVALVKQLSLDLPPDSRADTIYNLASYPGDDTVKLIRPLLNDPNTSEVQFYGPERKTIRYYPVRQAAYLALRILGEKLEPPQPNFPEVQSMLFSTGFETSSSPRERWRRYMDPAPCTCPAD